MAEIVSQDVSSRLKRSIGNYGDKAKKHWVDITEFSSYKIAIADGYDWQPAFQQAITSAQSLGYNVVFMPSGTYLIANTIFLPSNIALIGSGYSTKLKMSTTVTGVKNGIQNNDFTNGNDNITLMNFVLDLQRVERGLGEDAGSHGIRFQALEVRDGNGNITMVNQCENILISHVWVRNTPNAGMMLFSVKNCKTENCFVEDTMRDGISVWLNSENIQHVNNLMINVRDDCYGLNSEVTGHQNTQIKNVVITGGIVSHASDSIFGTAVRVAGVKDVTVTGVVSHDIQGTGIVVEGGFLSGVNLPSQRVNINGCTVKTTGFNVASNGHGISVSSAIGCNIIGNQVEDPYLNGINITNTASDINVKNNVVKGGRNSNGVGIFLGGAECSANNNDVLLTPSMGIAIEAWDCQVVGNKVTDACLQASGNPFIRVLANVSYSLINSNKCKKTQGNAGYGIRVSTGSSDYTLITGNVVRGFVAGSGVSNAGTGTNNILANNIGA